MKRISRSNIILLCAFALFFIVFLWSKSVFLSTSHHEGLTLGLVSEDNGSPNPFLKLDANLTSPHFVLDVNVDFVHSLMDAFRNSKIPTSSLLNMLVAQGKPILEKLPTLYHITVPKGGKITVVGDIHGSLFDLLYVFETAGYPSAQNMYVFTGDYVDRGPFSVEVFATVLAWKIAMPNYVHMLRGNHESAYINDVYGFYKELAVKYENEGLQLANLFNLIFQTIPLSVVISDQVLVLHGGLPAVNNILLNDIAKANRFDSAITENQGILNDILWSDPTENMGRHPSPRGSGMLFGPDISQQFMTQNNIKYMIRAHEPKELGYEVAHDGRVITIFSASDYCFSGNQGAFITIQENLQPEFTSYSLPTHPTGRLPECQRYPPQYSVASRRRR